MIVILCEYPVKANMMPHLIEALKQSNIEAEFRSQPGNLRFEYSIPLNRENMLLLTDVWKDEAAFNAHLSCNIMPMWTEVKEKYMAGESSFVRYDIP